MGARTAASSRRQRGFRQLSAGRIADGRALDLAPRRPGGARPPPAVHVGRRRLHRGEGKGPRGYSNRRRHLFLPLSLRRPQCCGGEGDHSPCRSGQDRSDWPRDRQRIIDRRLSSNMIRTEKRPSSAFTAIDFDKPGKQIGYVMFPHSPDDDAWGVTRVPIAVIANGRGPTVILEGGNHGDEYEGPIVIGELTRGLDPAEVQGRLILMPSNNVHAAMGSRRTSPVDGLNYNRTFPG